MDEHTNAPETKDAPGAAPASASVAALKETVDRHPYGTLAAAVGIGYALGGGIFTPLTARLVRFGLRIGLRAALLPIVTERITELVEEFAPTSQPQQANAAARSEGA